MKLKNKNKTNRRKFLGNERKPAKGKDAERKRISLAKGNRDIDIYEAGGNKDLTENQRNYRTKNI